jgi:hypothetical protein
MTDPTAVVRRALWASVPANVGVAAIMLAPDSALGRLVGLPAPAPHPVYRVLLALFLALFGGAYAWLATQPRIDRAFVAFGAIGKALAFASMAGLWLLGLASGRWTLLMAGDLAFAAVFAWWCVVGGRVDSSGTSRADLVE